MTKMGKIVQQHLFKVAGNGMIWIVRTNYFIFAKKNAGNGTSFFKFQLKYKLVNMIINLTIDWHANWRLYFQILMTV